MTKLRTNIFAKHTLRKNKRDEAHVRTERPDNFGFCCSTFSYSQFKFERERVEAHLQGLGWIRSGDRCRPSFAVPQKQIENPLRSSRYQFPPSSLKTHLSANQISAPWLYRNKQEDETHSARTNIAKTWRRNQLALESVHTRISSHWHRENMEEKKHEKRKRWVGRQTLAPVSYNCL